MVSTTSFIQNSKPHCQQRYEFFNQRDHIPLEILQQIKHPEEAKEVGFFLYNKKERITGVSISSDGFLAKIYTVSQDNIIRIWGKRLRKSRESEKEGEKFTLSAEIKPRPKGNPVLLPVPSAAVD